MKKLMLVCCFVIGATAISFAQGGGGRGPQKPPAEQAKDLQASLKLTDDQTAKVTAIYVEQAAKRDSVMKAAGEDRRAGMTAFRPMQTAYMAKIQALLTDDQKAAWKKMQDEMAARRAQGGGGGMGGGGTPPPPTK